ncbi:hypothetical protein [Streptomyces sp. NPDC093071]|uniref:hypothetical protein n=1 Tax=Streptomyces sp. NPDC093071 TaxID=3366022 RepID=UPI00382148E8
MGGTLSQARREQPEEIAPSWCPTWPVEWQRALHLVRRHLDEGGALSLAAGEVVRRGEVLGRWARARRLGFDKPASVRQRMCEHVPGITPATEEEKPKARVSQAEKRGMHHRTAGAR